MYIIRLERLTSISFGGVEPRSRQNGIFLYPRFAGYNKGDNTSIPHIS